MALPIQALPKGLVAFLDLNTGGAGPGAIAEQIAGVLDLRDFYLLNKRERVLITGVSSGTAAGSFAFGANATVPANEAWLVYQYTIQTPFAIGLILQQACCVQSPMGGGNQNLMVGDPVTNANAALGGILICSSREPFVAVPGAILGGITLAISAAVAASSSATIDFVRFRL